jgi:tetratricopeptide (TPR) repeat protein
MNLFFFKSHGMKALLAALLWQAGMTVALAEAEPQAAWDAANRLYESGSSGSMAQAREAYQALLEAGACSAGLYYNLGNAHYRLGQPGEAAVAYARALFLNPAHPEARANLRLIQTTSGARVANPEGAGSRWELPHDPTQQGMVWLAAGGFWLAVGGMAPRLLGRRTAWLPTMAGVLLLGWSGTALWLGQGERKTWIVKSEGVQATVAPVDHAPATAALPIGSEVSLLLERGAWLYVAIPGVKTEGAGNAGRGWILRTAAEPVVPPSSR